LRPFKIDLIVAEWQNSLSRFCGLSSLSSCGSFLIYVVVPFAILADSRPFRCDGVFVLSLLIIIVFLLIIIFFIIVYCYFKIYEYAS